MSEDQKALSQDAAPLSGDALVTASLLPSVSAATVVAAYAKDFGANDGNISALRHQLAVDVEGLWAGDMKRPEAMLLAQAQALQSIFTQLARRAENQPQLQQWDAYLRMALKAQNQCRMTLETLATIKNPPVVFARQANINNGGQQQVNNGCTPQAVNSAHSAQACAGAHAANSQTAPTELLEAIDAQRLDAGAACTTGETDSHLAPLGAVHRPANR